VVPARDRVPHAVLMFAVLAACAPAAPDLPLAGDPAAGARVIARVKCGVCHEIPGIPGAHGVVGPPLTGFARRSYIAGVLPNDPTRLVPWILDAPSLVPETLMPAQPLARREAQDAAAFLYTLL